MEYGDIKEKHIRGYLIQYLYKDRLAERTALIEKKREARKDTSLPDYIKGYREQLRPVLTALINEGCTFQGIATKLNTELSFPTPRGIRKIHKGESRSESDSWSPSMVYRLCCITGAIEKTLPVVRKKREKGELLKYIDKEKYSQEYSILWRNVAQYQRSAASEWFIDRWPNDLAYHDALAIAALVTLMGRDPKLTYRQLAETLTEFEIQRPIAGTAVKKWEESRTQWTVGIVHILIRKYRLYPQKKEAPVPAIALELNPKGETHAASASPV